MEIIKKTLLLFLASAAILVPIKLNAQKTDAKPIVYFVHGLQIADWGETDPDKVKRKLEEIFPDSEIRYYKWDSWVDRDRALLSVITRSSVNVATVNVVDLEKCKEAFGKFYSSARFKIPPKLADELCRMPRKQLKRVILVGHSLGGVIVVKTMEILAKKGLYIDRGIFLGTAYYCDEDGCNSITTAIQASKHFNINIYNVKDEALVDRFKNWHGGEFEAFGAHGYKKICPKHWLMQIEDTTHKEKTLNLADNHDVMNYLDDLDKFFQDYRKIFPEK